MHNAGLCQATFIEGEKMYRIPLLFEEETIPCIQNTIKGLKFDRSLFQYNCSIISGCIKTLMQKVNLAS